MPLSSSIVGQNFPVVAIAVTPRMALAYAAGLGDDSALDDMEADFAALPFFCVSLEWQFQIAARSQMGLTPYESARAVHAGQNTRFLKTLRPGQTVRVLGRIVEVRSSRAGALSVTHLVVKDENGGDISSTYSTTIYRGVGVAGDDKRVESDEAALPADWEFQGATEDIIALDRGFPHRYSECANIWNPIHTERKAALAAGLPDIIVHETALWALAGKTIHRRFAPTKEPRLASLSGCLTAMVIAGTPITIRTGRASAAGEVLFEVLNERGEKAISGGRATFSAR